MLKIWGRTNSVNVQKVMWCIGELGLEHARVDAGGQFGQVKEDWYLAMNPNALVPTIDDDGFILWESNATVRYLAAKYDSGGLWPDDPQARALSDRWMDWQLGTLLPHVGVVFWGLIRTPEAERDMAAIEAAVAKAGELYAILDRHLEGRDFIAGDRLTVGDIPLGALTYRWYGLPIERPERPNVYAWYQRLAERPAYREHVMLPIT